MNDGLAVARPVGDEFVPIMTNVEEVDPETLQKQEEEEHKRKDCRWIGYAIIAICAVVLGLSFGLTNGKKDNTQASPNVAPSLAPSDSPSAAPTGSLDLLREGLPEYTLASLEIYDSPQWKAWDWLINHHNISRLEEWRKRQLFALATFYYAFSGENWNHLIQDRWMDYNKHECGWFSSGFGWFDQTGEYGAQNLAEFQNENCNDDKEYIALHIENLQLFGYSTYVPAEITLLTSLSTISFGHNNISGSLLDVLPSELFQMTTLTKIGFDWTGLNGPVPSQLGLMTSMTTLLLYGNALTGTIPSELARMTDMVQLEIEDNSLLGPLPSEFGLMTNLTGLHLYNNDLTGWIPSEMGRMTRMIDLDMEGNSVTGEIPTEMGRMSDIVDLRLDGNDLTGHLPSELGLMTSLTKLYLQSNSLSGLVPSQLALMTSLEQLRLEDNILTGTVPVELESFIRVNGSLIQLTLANNSFFGTIPEGLCSLGLFDADVGRGLSFDCSDELCGCCWCPCPGSNYSDDCDTRPFIPSRDDNEWPGSFPLPLNRSNAITINVRTDAYPEEIYFEWSEREESGFWKVLESESPSEKEDLHSYTYEVASDSIYRLQLVDEEADGSCCYDGLGWFTITSSIPSNDYVNGTVIWEAAGYDVMEKVEVYLSIDPNGHAKLEKSLFYEEAETEELEEEAGDNSSLVIGLQDGQASSNFTHDDQGEA